MSIRSSSASYLRVFPTACKFPLEPEIVKTRIQKRGTCPPCKNGGKITFCWRATVKKNQINNLGSATTKEAHQVSRFHPRRPPK
jgi:hypothetical protein